MATRSSAGVLPFVEGIMHHAIDNLGEPAFGGAATLRRRRGMTVEEIRRQVELAQHPATSPAPVLRRVDHSHAYSEIKHRAPAEVSWPRASVRLMQGIKPGEEVWAVKIWEAPGVPARDAAGRMIAFTEHLRQTALMEAGLRVSAMRRSKLARLRLEGEPQQEPPC